MSYVVTVNEGADEELEIFTTIHEMKNWLKSRIDYWNNFEENYLAIKVEKENDDEAIKIEVKDDIETGDRFG